MSGFHKTLRERNVIMEKNDMYYYEKNGEMFAVKKISEYDIDYSIKASHHAYEIWKDMRLSVSRKLKYYSLQEDGYFYFEMKSSIPKKIFDKLTLEEIICDKSIYIVPKEFISSCANMRFSSDNKKALEVYTDKSKFCDSSYINMCYGKANIYDVASYLADNQYCMSLNESIYMNTSEVYAVCDYPIYKSSISCEIRNIHKMNDTGYFRCYPKTEKGELLKDYKNRLEQYKDYTESGGFDIAVNISKHIKDSMNEILSLIKHTKQMIDKGSNINLMLCVNNKKQKEEVNDLINSVFNPIKTLH